MWCVNYIILFNKKENIRIIEYLLLMKNIILYYFVKIKWSKFSDLDGVFVN